MREKLETLSLVQLRELGKSQGLKVSGLRKAQIIDLLCEIADRANTTSMFIPIKFMLITV